MSNKFQVIIDRFWGRTLIPLLPPVVTPNSITIIRLALIIPLGWLIAVQQFLPALGLFVFAALLDSLDGSLSRIRNLQSSKGAILDAIFDKVFIGLIYLIMIISLDNLWLKSLVAFSFFGEILVILIGFGFGFKKGAASVPKSNRLGKLKMFLQTIFCLVFFLSLIYPLGVYAPWQLVLITIIILLQFSAGFSYLFKFLRS